jgi:hypothetical protein
LNSPIWKQRWREIWRQAMANPRVPISKFKVGQLRKCLADRFHQLRWQRVPVVTKLTRPASENRGSARNPSRRRPSAMRHDRCPSPANQRSWPRS